MVPEGPGVATARDGGVDGADPPLLMSIRQRAPRLALRTACERLPPEDRARILAR